MKTILHTIDTTGPGGAETVFVDLASRLPEEAYRPLVVIRGKGWVFDELCRRGLEPIIMEAKGSFNWRYLKNLVSLVNREKVDLIQSHLLGSNVYCSLAGMITRKPVVATFHGMVDIGENERLKGLKFRVINKGTCRVVAVSNSLSRNIIDRTHINSEKLSVVYNGINTVDFDVNTSNDLRTELGWGRENIVIGSLGNIRMAKGYDILLRAAAIVKNRTQRCKFVIAGQGKGRLYRDLLKLRDELGLEDTVHFLGFSDDPVRYLSSLDVFLLSSTSEGFSIATIQAMAAGIPVIATKSGGPEEIVSDGENGILVDPGSPGSIAEAVEKLTEDLQLRDKLAANGRSHAIQEFDLSTMLSRYRSIYTDCI